MTVLPRRAWRDRPISNTHNSQPARDRHTIGGVAVTDKVAWCLIPRERFSNLPGDPLGGWIRGHIGPDEPSPFQTQDDQSVQQLEPDRRNDEQINGSDVGGMVAQERPPPRRGRAATLDHVFGNRGLGDVDTQLQQLAIDAWRTPERVVAVHHPDQIADIGRDRRPTDTTTRLPAPVQAEAAPMPAHQRFRLEDDRGSQQ